MKPTILIIDDDENLRTVLAGRLKSMGYCVQTAPTGEAGLAFIQRATPTFVVLDLCLPGIDGIEVLDRIRATDPELAVAILTGHGDIATAVKAMKMGAEHFLVKPFELKTLDLLVERVVQRDKRQKHYEFLKERAARLNGKPILDRKTLESIAIMGKNPDTTVLITGPTGAGKSLVAQLIHQESSRREAPFVEINCAGLSKELLDSELFGYERGAFTDAKRKKKGLMEVADSGSLFLDEIGEMPLATQAKVLNAFETKSFRRLGGTERIEVNIRIIAATNADLEKKREAGQFREDLYYRLNVLPIHLPALNQRLDDIPVLAMSFLDEFRRKMNKSVVDFSAEALEILVQYPWPGNIRELRNVVERAAILCSESRIKPEHLPGISRSGNGSCDPAAAPAGLTTIADAEKRLILHTLAHTRTRAAAARVLGIDVSTLQRKIKRWGLR